MPETVPNDESSDAGADTATVYGTAAAVDARPAADSPAANSASIDSTAAANAEPEVDTEVNADPEALEDSGALDSGAIDVPETVEEPMTAGQLLREIMVRSPEKKKDTELEAKAELVEPVEPVEAAKTSEAAEPNEQVDAPKPAEPIEASESAEPLRLHTEISEPVLTPWLEERGVSAEAAGTLELVLRVALVLVSMWVVSHGLRFGMRWLAKKSILRRFSSEDQDLVLNHGVFRWGGHTIVSIIGLLVLLIVWPGIIQLHWLLIVIRIWIWFAFFMTVSRLVRAINAALQARSNEYSNHVPMRSIEQLVDLVLLVIGMLVLVSTIAGTNPVVLLSGLGAFSAILLLIFKDSLVGFISALQLAANDMVRRGDWITASDQVDGTVREVTLTTIKVENFDRTMAHIPPYKLVSEPFINWRTVTSGPGRRVARSLLIDLRSIAPLRAEQLEDLKKMPLMHDYLFNKVDELKHWDESSSDNYPRQLTNLGTFRAYCLRWIRSRTWVNDQLTILVRQLEPTAQGLPLQLYFFSRNTDWVVFESDQSETFEHLFSMLPRFGLRAFQSPAGNDLELGLGSSKLGSLGGSEMN